MSFTHFILALYSLYTRFNVALIEILTRPKKRGTLIGEIRVIGGICNWKIGLKWNADDADDADFIFSLKWWNDVECGLGSIE